MSSIDRVTSETGKAKVHSASDCVESAQGEDVPTIKSDNEPNVSKKDWRFWIVIVSLCIVGTLGSLEGTVVATALPSIVADLSGESLYIWAVNAYFLTTWVLICTGSAKLVSQLMASRSTAFQPLYGQLSDIIGRKSLIVSAVCLFILGSGISGGASSMEMLIAGRTVQGIGGGGVTMMVEVVVSDLVPVRERGTYIGIVLAACTIGTALGPIIGGLFVEHVTWRWAFWINLPIGGAACLLLVPFYHSQKRTRPRLAKDLLEVDIIGNLILIASITSILIALSYGGSMYTWRSYRVIVPLVLGILGLCAWIGFEFSSYCARPTVPLRFWSNRTASISFILTFLQSIVLTWVGYFLPIYFQGLYGSSPGRCGVQLLATLLPIMAAGVLGGIGINITGRYKPFQLAGFALVSISLGLFSLLDRSSSTGAWVGFQVLFGLGGGLTSSVLLQSAQATFPDTDTAVVTGFWAFMRSFGYIWGIAISAAVFDNRTANYASLITESSALREAFAAGGAYQRATKTYVDSLAGSPLLQSQVLSVFRNGLRDLWEVCLAFALLAFVLNVFIKEIRLRSSLDQENAAPASSIHVSEAPEKKV